MIMFNCATLMLFIIVTCIFIAKCQKKKKWMSEGQRLRLHSCSLKWKVLQTGKSRANKHSLTLPTWRIDPGGFLFFFFFKYILFLIFLKCSTQSAVFFHTPDTPTQHGLTWATASSWALKNGAATPGALNCLKLSNHNLAPWAAGPSLQARASLQTYPVAF